MKIAGNSELPALAAADYAASPALAPAAAAAAVVLQLKAAGFASTHLAEGLLAL
eukprot:CAMPEP_0174762226 /NCGR_PEP_ID=MMETSP1094-20130205/109673_1 /TAXON_ID=156173 /ORGANISM="Chrysochromulina brevifilum, Strain UTEX LB 985" /LENGTH=53 /DNA_ID=CAMNT_0015968179 /DNA_START=562 /DNA_END=724 /DNA_ORIENTATION=+